jgi:hypothetical protein
LRKMRTDSIYLSIDRLVKLEIILP